MPPVALGDKKITRAPFSMLAVMMAPLVLGGCGAPLGLQIASLFADGISFLTTEKTLTDHGLSVIADQDCAVWRGLKGEEVCRDEVFDAPDLADIGEPAPSEEEGEAKVPPMVADVPVEPAGSVAPSPGAGITTASIEEADALPDKAGKAPPSAGVEAKAKGGTFYVIASYRRLAGAKRFARGQLEWVTKVIAGTASGRTVYRVAIGPVPKAHRRFVRNRLIKDGFPDAWKLTLKNPKVIVELAAFN